MALVSRFWSMLLPPTPATSPGWSCFLCLCWRLVAPLSVPPPWTSFCWFRLENTWNRYRFTPEGKGVPWQGKGVPWQVKGVSWHVKGVPWHVRCWEMSTRLWEQCRKWEERSVLSSLFLYPTWSRKGSYCIHLCLLL